MSDFCKILKQYIFKDDSHNKLKKYFMVLVKMKKRNQGES